jgi:hypothetical protein
MGRAGAANEKGPAVHWQVPFSARAGIIQPYVGGFLEMGRQFQEE